MMADWSARVECAAGPGTQLDAAAGEQLTIRLDAPVAVDSERQRVAATLRLEASTLRQATDAALRTFTAAAAAAGLTVRPVAVRVLPWDDYVAELDRPPVPPLVGYAEIAQLADVSRQRAAQLADLDGFPPQVATVSGAPAFVRASVEAFLNHRTRRTGRPRRAEIADTSG